MQRLGFIHDMMDVKVLLLLVLSRCNYPVSTQEAYELCYQDDCLSYFDVCTALPEMVKSGHIRQVEGEKYDPGKQTLSVPTFANVAEDIPTMGYAETAAILEFD